MWFLEKVKPRLLVYALNGILIWSVKFLWCGNLVRIKTNDSTSVLSGQVSFAIQCTEFLNYTRYTPFQVTFSLHFWSAVKRKRWIHGRLTAMMILCSHPLQIPMSARIPKVTVVTSTPYVPTLKDRTSVDVLEGTKEMVEPAQVKLLIPFLSLLENVFGKCA